MNEESEKIALWRYLTWVPVFGCLLTVAVLRNAGDSIDFGIVTVLTYILLLSGWIFAAIAFWATISFRAAAALLVVPPVLGGALLSFFRFERFDSELNPRFTSRWAAASKLPEAPRNSGADVANAEDSAAQAQKSLFAPRATDFTEFLGPARDATMRETQLQTDWSLTPPTIAWKQPIGQGWSGFAVQGDAAYTMEQRDQAEWVTCYNANTGELIWSFEIPSLHTNPLGGTGPRSTPTIRNGKVYAVSAVSDVVCLDMRTGEKIWSFDLTDAASGSQSSFESNVNWGRSGSPLVIDGRVYIPLGGPSGKPMQSLIALDAETGQELWRGGSDQVSYSTPVFATLRGQPQILLVSESKLSSHSPEDGSVLWSLDWPGHSNSDANVSQPIAIDDSRVLISKGYGAGAQLIEVTKSGEQWEVKSLWKEQGVLKTKFTSCVIHAGHAFGLSDGILECVDIETGKRAWKKGRYRHGQVLLVGETLLITAESGDLVLVAADPAAFRELASMPVIGDVTWNTPALSGNRLLMRNSNEAACVLLPLVGQSELPASANAPAQETTSGETLSGEASTEPSQTSGAESSLETKGSE